MKNKTNKPCLYKAKRDFNCMSSKKDVRDFMYTLGVSFSEHLKFTRVVKGSLFLLLQKEEIWIALGFYVKVNKILYGDKILYMRDDAEDLEILYQ